MSPARTAPADSASHADARRRLIAAAIDVFSERGYARAATREICQRAEANVAAIHYYFGSKEALYREILQAPMQQLGESIGRFSAPGLGLPAALRAYFDGMLAPLAAGVDGMKLHRLYSREFVEPTGIVAMDMPQVISRHFHATIELLVRHLGLPGPDEEVRTLAFALVGLAHFQVTARDLVAAFSTAPARTPEAVAALSGRLAGYGLALIASERARRSGDAPAPEATP